MEWLKSNSWGKSVQQDKTIASGRRNFIRVIEVWTPNESGEVLKLDAALYGELEEFGQLSAKTSFVYGEGLPGKAWQQKRPLVLKDFDATTFLRASAAREAGLTAAVAIPIFDGSELNAVLVMLCGDLSEATGAIEVWQDDDLSGLALVDGYFGDMERFAWLSKHIRFPPGSGLPGSVWQSGRAQVIGDLGHSTSFMRAHNAVAAGIKTAIGIPFYSPDNKLDMAAVLTFLSANDTPIARRFEVWEEDLEAGDLRFVSGIDQATDQVESQDPGRRIARGEGLIGQTFESGVPSVSDQLSEGDFESLLAIPILRPEQPNAVIAFYN